MGKFIISVFFTLFFIFLLNQSWGPLPPIAKVSNPYAGIWQNATNDFPHKNILLENLYQDVSLSFDSNLIPQIRAKNILDAVQVQGYLHAYYRLWQMDMLSRLACGKLSEVIGVSTLETDRYQRRLGMVYGAENTLEEIKKDSLSYAILQSYTKGVNTFISSIQYKNYPIEYKLMNFKPSLWTELKSVAIMKYMAYTLSSSSNDISNSIAKHFLDSTIFHTLFPDRLKEEYPIINENYSPILNTNTNKIDDAHFIEFQKAFATSHETINTDIGSNNWAIHASKSKTHNALLCNDPHLPLSFPSIWYQIQISTDNANVYGVSLPGNPLVVIGFNDSISWGFTNGYRDVIDYYAIHFSDSSYKTYLLNNIPTEFNSKIEEIKIKSKKTFYDTVLYTVYGPMMYDKNFPLEFMPNNNLAVQWMAHKGSNELSAIYQLNHAKNYLDYTQAIKHFHSPHQNIVYADVKGNIALWSQGLFVKKFIGQGSEIMDGNQISNQWQSFIDMDENPHTYNPPQAYVMSANQVNTNKSYPYWYNGMFDALRAKRLYNLLNEKNDFTIADMMQFQLDNYDQMAKDFASLFPKLPQTSFYADTKNTELTLIHLCWEKLKELLFTHTIPLPSGVKYPSSRAVLEFLSNEKLWFNKDSLFEIAYAKAKEEFELLKQKNQAQFWKYKNSRIEHLAKIPTFSLDSIEIGGGQGILNAAHGKNGPSWRMIVEMSKPVKAWAIYPGGQSGNPLSSYYNNFVEPWRKGEYKQIILLKENDKANTIYHINFKTKHAQ